MRTTILLLLLLASESLAIAQQNWGTITFGNRNIPKSDGTGTYDVPLRDYQSGAGLGSDFGGATLGLFLLDPSAQFGIASGPFVTLSMGTTSASSPYTVGGTRTVAVPGYPPGFRAVIVVRAWTSQGPRGEWIFTTLPLGGIPSGGGAEIPTPGLSGWGPEDGSGISVTPWPPKTVISGPVEGTIYAAPATIQIGASYGGDPGLAATSFAVYAGPILVADQIPRAGEFKTYVTPPLGAGKYSLYSVVSAGYTNGTNFVLTGTTQSIPINITVVDPVNLTLTPLPITGGQLRFEYPVNPGLTYAVQVSSGLKNWLTIQTNKPTNSPALFTWALSSAPVAYFRVQRMPNP